jgi:glycosyltransferase involved in cell wall biosynthesis
MRVALLSANARAGDAIGNQVAEKLAFFFDRGADVRVFLESGDHLHPVVGRHCRVVNDIEPDAETSAFLSSADLIVVEYGHFYTLLHWLPLLVRRRAGDMQSTPQPNLPPQGGREPDSLGGPRILFDYHGVTPTDVFGPHNREGVEKGARQRGLVWCADAALTHSRFTRRELLEPTGFPPDRTFCLAHPIDLSRLCPGPARQRLQERLGLGEARVLLFVGRLAANKRVPLLVEALGRLRELTPPVHAVVIGDARDVYALEGRRCLDRAGELGIADRLHLLGVVDDDALLDAYRSADAFVMPSIHEGFCIPVVEAMGCGLPVIAAGAGALPETLAGAGITFIPDDAEDLARQVNRVLSCSSRQSVSTAHPDPSPQVVRERGHAVHERAARPVKVAVVPLHYGIRSVGGAEKSLAKMAEALAGSGHAVEIFTIEAHGNGSRGLPVHEFGADRRDLDRYRAAAHAISERGGSVSADVEEAFLRQSVHSSALLDELRRRIEEFDAVITGPYLSGVAADVARAFPGKTLLVPCFHDEAAARQSVWHRVYGDVAGMLFHSRQEQDFAQAELGFSSPGSACVGTVIDAGARADKQRGRHRVTTALPYIVYCGRYVVEKNFPALLEYARRYSESHPERFVFVFMGEGPVPVPKAPWACNLGLVSENAKDDVLADAAALVQLSLNESLSLAALETWAHGVPVLANRYCAVLVAHFNRCGGGRAIDSYESFAAALDDLWQNPGKWQEFGRRGQHYVRQEYGSLPAFTRVLQQAIEDLKLPLAERMRRRQKTRAAELERPRWRQQFTDLVDELVHGPGRPYRGQIDVRPRADSRTVDSGAGMVLVPVRVSNLGTHAVVADGPGRVALHAVVSFEQTTDSIPRREIDQPASRQVHGPAVPLPSLLMPGQTLAAAVPVPVPTASGIYLVTFQASGREGHCEGERASMRLIVQQNRTQTSDGCCTPMLDAIQAALVEAQRLQRLPDGYTDVTTGKLAAWKRWIKRKLLGNFQRAYVDVLSRQQSAFNERILLCLNELAQCLGTLESAAAEGRANGGGQEGSAEASRLIEDLQDELAKSRQRCADLEACLLELKGDTSCRESRATDTV